VLRYPDRVLIAPDILSFKVQLGEVPAMVTIALGLLDEDRRGAFMTDFSYIDVHVPRYGL
jgi:hypothetical protein